MATALEQEIGHGNAGLTPWSAFVDVTETVSELAWPNSINTYSAMRTDAQIALLLLAFTLPIRRYYWYVDPNSARELALELQNARRRRVGLTAQPVALTVGDERQLACGQAPRQGFWRARSQGRRRRCPRRRLPGKHLRRRRRGLHAHRVRPDPARITTPTRTGAARRSLRRSVRAVYATWSR
jgi:hypothetical protein